MPITRRQFLESAAFLSAAWAAQTSATRDTVLVALQLAGGNDGLNTVVPYEDDHYGRNRTTLRLTANQVIKIGSSLGFHPELRGFERLFKEGRLTVVQGVGYPNMHRDHNVGMRAWQTGNPTAADETGWLGRVADRTSDPDSGNVPAVFVGQIPPPLALHAAQVIVPGIRNARDWTLAAGAPAEAGTAKRDDALLDFAARATSAARVKARKISAVLQAGQKAEYPAYALAQSLRTVSQLIRADIGIRTYLVELGGVSPGTFDNHSNQAQNQAVVLRELSDSVAAFCDDLGRDKQLDRVLLMTYSEFGRQLTENGRHGTGHGAAAPVFLTGGKLKGGLVGAHPSLADLDADAPKPHTDFRRVYATALDAWLRIPSEPILGGRFTQLEVFAS